MTLELSYTAKVDQDGIIQGLARKKLAKELKGSFAGMSIEILIHRKKKHRSVQQNRTYWLYCTMLSEETGFTKDEIHAVLKQKFLKTEKVHEDSGQVFEYVRSTSELSTVEFMDYIAQIQQFAAEDLNVVLPDPGTQMDLMIHSQSNKTL